MKMIMTKSELAREWGVCHTRISNLLSEGYIVENRNGRIDFRVSKNKKYLEARENRKAKTFEQKLAKDKNLQNVLEICYDFFSPMISEHFNNVADELINMCKNDKSKTMIVKFLTQGLNNQLKNSLEASKRSVLELYITTH